MTRQTYPSWFTTDMRKRLEAEMAEDAQKRQAWRDVVEKISVGHEPFIKLPKARHSPAQTGEAVAATNSN